MPSDAFVARLTEQVGNEFAASQQYVAGRAPLRRRDAPPPAPPSSTRQALEERNHAMMLVQYLLDAEVRAGAARRRRRRSRRSPTSSSPSQLALEQERRGDRADQRARRRRRAQDGDYTSEQFLQWFLKEQVEEVATMNDLLTRRDARAGEPAAGRGVPRPRGHRRGGRRRPDRAAGGRRRGLGAAPQHAGVVGPAQRDALGVEVLEVGLRELPRGAAARRAAGRA